ncbi:Slc12a5 [Symbiodinium sp. CCMP2592]|nr:Slc12a5 [Symbiodinium sp. CCMP2592]
MEGSGEWEAQVNHLWALAACLVAGCLYLFVNWKVEAKEWGSAMDGITFRLALSALVQLEQSQYQHVNWRPQVLIIYSIPNTEEGTRCHEGNLRFASQLRKGKGFCMVACVLESSVRDTKAQLQAAKEKQVIKDLMAKEGIEGFAEVVVAPNMAEGAHYIIQLTGIGGLVPNTVMLDWPEDRADTTSQDFVEILSHAYSADKAVIAVKGLKDMPLEEVKGPRSTIDVWWMIHDGGFLILLSWLLTQHRNWRQSQIRVFTLAEDVSEEKAKAAGEFLSRTLRERRLFDVEVEVILADDAMIQPYTYDWTWRVEGRHQFLSSLRVAPAAAESIPLEIDDLFVVDENSCVSADPRDPPCSSTSSRSVDSRCGDPEDSQPGNVLVSDCRTDRSAKETGHVMRNRCHTRVSQPPLPMCARLPPAPEFTNLESCARLNQVVLSRSSEADLVVLNLPDQWGTEAHKARAFMTYCNTLTAGLRHVMFVHSSGHEADSWFQKTRQGALHPELQGLRPDRASFDVMIQGCAKVDDLTRAERYLIDLLERTSDRPHRNSFRQARPWLKRGRSMEREGVKFVWLTWPEMPCDLV